MVHNLAFSIGPYFITQNLILVDSVWNSSKGRLAKTWRFYRIFTKEVYLSISDAIWPYSNEIFAG